MQLQTFVTLQNHQTSSLPYESFCGKAKPHTMTIKPIHGRSSVGIFFKRKQGFALIATLSLMILLAIIAIGLLTLSSITMRSGSHGVAEAQARSNARLALMMAIGQLQSELGPDQRINATADLAGSGLNEGRERWVGTWDSWPAGQNQRPEAAGMFRRWLVSGEPDRLNDSSFPSTASNLVPLLQDGTSTLMSAPLVELKNGGMAYVISDENAKARLGSISGLDSEDIASHLSRIQAAPADHREFPSLVAVSRTDSQLDRLVSHHSAELLPDAGMSTIEQSTSFTVWSEGLLTDVRNGGFRKDLSLHLHDPASGDPTKALYQHNGRRGINFRELRAFHEVSSRLTYNASSFSHPDGGQLNSKVPAMVGSSAQATAATDPYFAYLRPLVIRGSWHISAFTRSEGDPRNPSYRLFVVLEPIVWLWNPFDTNLVIPPGGHMSVRCWGIPYDITIRAGNTSRTTHFNRIRPAAQGGQANNIAMEIGQNTPVVMRPGEVQIFSRGRQATTPVNQFGRFEGRLGYSGTGGFSLDTGVVVNSSTPITLSMAASPTRGADRWGVIEFLEYVGTDAQNNYWNGGIMIDRADWQGEIAATNFPREMFPPVPDKTFSSGAELVTPQPLALFSYFARTEREGMLRSRYLAQLTPGAMGFDHQSADANTLHSLPYEASMQALDGGLDRGFDFNDGKGFFGASYKADVGQSHLVTHSIPRERPISLGSFQHAIANGVEKWTFTGPGAGIFHDRILQPSISHPVGNSFAPPSIAPERTTGTFNAMAAVDHSYLANQALWDEWFVSSLADRNAPHHVGEQRATAQVLFERLAGRNGEVQPLPNQHFRYAGEAPAADTSRLFNRNGPTADAFVKVASLLRIHGAFNINSTDPAAWLAMIRSSHGLRVPVEPAEGTASRWEAANNPFAGLLIPKGPAVSSNDLGDPSSEAQWIGYRDPSDEELEEFAIAMVEEVKAKGPFLSLADFVNRRLEASPSTSSSGALQAALDRSINKKLESGARSSSGGAAGTAFPEADSGSMMTHVPGHVKQGDVLTTIGSRFTPRSDTFTIRAYGEARSASGDLLASARCEAVVQRDASYLDSADNSELLPSQLTSEANKRFGRKFNMVSFRWIAHSEP